MRNKNNFSKLLLCLSMVLIAVIAITVAGCGKNEPVQTAEPSAVPKSENSAATTVGEGEKQFNFAVTSASGTVTEFVVKTDKQTVGEALIDAGLIAGEDGAYGLYVKTVNGETLDYDKDGKYWAFYSNGSYATAGADKTNIESGVDYEFKAE